MKKVLFLSIFLIAASAARAEVSLPHVFSDHMVLQRDMRIPVWGKAAPGERVAVALGSTCEGTTTADAAGRWRVELPAQKAGGPIELSIRGSNTITIRDVLIGEVWVASGQSNMQFQLERASNGEASIATANLPQIREFQARAVVAEKPRDDVEGNWKVCSPQTAAKFSAVGFFFARELSQRLKVPFGILHVSQGWTPAEAWMSREALSSQSDFKRDILDKWDEIARLYPESKKRYDEEMVRWKADEEKAKAEHKPEPAQPKSPRDPSFIHRATGLWNGSVAPLTPFAVRGVIWYQGETNDNRGYQYRKLFPALINDWRKNWNRPDLLFLFVQLASVLPPDAEPVESEWAEVREAQLMALSLPHTGMAVTIDVGEEKDVHPKNKEIVGQRLARIARSKVYGQKLEYSGPLYRSMQIKGNQTLLSFENLNRGLSTPENKPLDGFDIAGADRKFHHAEARIVGKEVVVWSDKVLSPVAVRYAWANNPMPRANLFSKTQDGALLPASPFRTDDWPGKSFADVTMPIERM